MTRDLLLEIGCEDLPARFVAPLMLALVNGVADGLLARSITWGDKGPGHEPRTGFATPRRIAVLLEGLPEQQPDQVVERFGPKLQAAYKDGEPTKAASGFARSVGVEVSELQEKDGKLFFSAREAGRPIAELLPEIFEETLKKMDSIVPKRMRWGAGEETFVRPVSWICCLLGDAVIPLRRFGLEAGRVTYGHRFHAPDAIELKSPSDYVESLRKAHVVANFVERRKIIRQQIESLASTLGGQVRIDKDLLEEVTALVEWPVAISGQFEASFLDLPPEVIVTTVETNQRYFPVFADAQHTQLTSHFITVSNIDSRDVEQVVSGNERVVRPRLADALFFWEQDLKQPLSAYRSQLSNVTFQKDLGSIGDKVQRIEKLVSWLGTTLGIDTANAERAAAQCKSDLVTRMVFEMPELQGIMGGYYARKAGDPDAVADAIRDHYLPTQQGTPIPATRDGQLVALADKLDTLAGIFAIGQKPTASKDPFALRRAALGILRICLEGDIELDIAGTVRHVLTLQPAGKADAAAARELRDFIAERLSHYLIGSERGDGRVTPEIFEAAERGAGDHLIATDIARRVDAVLAFLKRPEAQNLAAANKRARNILGKSDGQEVRVDMALFEHDAERALHAAMDEADGRNSGAADFTQKLVNLAGLRAPIDQFFEDVMVNAEDEAVRNNRLALLRRFDGMCREVADLSCLPGV